MNKDIKQNKLWQYVTSEGLDKLVPFIKSDSTKNKKAFNWLRGNKGVAFPPDLTDLVRIHKLIRQRKCFTVLEFGVGYSTVVMADALEKNEKDWIGLSKKPEIRNRFLFRIFSVDTSKKWIEFTSKNISPKLKRRVKFIYSPVKIGTFNGQLCHYFTNLPDIVPDFIYLDGPFVKHVRGKINGLSFQCDERTVMSGDLLLMESTFLPGTFILVDGRTNNTRFLQRNFSRKYKIHWDKKGDATTFELKEERLGKYNILGSDFFIRLHRRPRALALRSLGEAR